jgi:homospermidine synthase
LLPVKEGDLVVDLSIGTDTLTVAGMCVERGAFFVNSAIEDWLPDGWTPPENILEESMYYAHTSLLRRMP